MKTMKIWRSIFMMLAAFSLASCSSDDDEETVSGSDAQRALFEMKNSYSGKLRYGLKDEANRQILEGYTARSGEGLTISLPLEPIAEQVKDAAIAQKIRALAYAEVYATYQFEAVEKDGNAQFVLQPQMVADERMAAPLTRTSPVTYSGLTLLFTGTYTGNFVKANEALVFNICVGQVLIDNEPLEGFQPILFHFEGDTKTPAKPYESLWKSTCQIRYSLFGISGDLLKFYDVTAEYLDANGQQQTGIIADGQWLYEPEPLFVINVPEEFKCRIVATRKSNLPEFTDDFYEIGYGISSHVSFFNAKGEEVYKVKQNEPSSFTWETDKVGMQIHLL